MKNHGKRIEELSRNDAIVITDPGIVVKDIPVYSWLKNQCAMALDSKNQPHVATFKLPGTFKPEKLRHDPPPAVRERLRFFHYWRHPDGNWNSSGPLEMPKGLTINLPDIVIDKEDTVVIYWASNHGFRCYVASASDKWKTWRMLTLTGPGLVVTHRRMHQAGDGPGTAPAALFSLSCRWRCEESRPRKRHRRESTTWRPCP